MDTPQLLITLAHGFVGWTLCSATMFVGMATMSMENTLVVHAIGAPLFFGIVSLVYAKYFNYATPLKTAAIFVSLVIAIDFFLVALVINRSLEMFTSALGTWIPFALIFASSYVTLFYAGRFVKIKQREGTRK